jgi:hypothetical protein
LAASLAPALGLPLIAKDEIKQALMEVLGPLRTVDQSRELGRASVMAMLTVAKSSPGAVLDSTFYPYTVDHLRQLRPPLIEIRCVCPREIVRARYQARSKSRTAGHFDDQRSPEELWHEHHLKPLRLGPLIEADTSTSFDVNELVNRVLQKAATPPMGPPRIDGFDDQ